MLPVVTALPERVAGDGSTGPCVGRAVPDNQIIYKSEPGFHGNDRVFYVVDYVSGRRGLVMIDIAVP